MATLNAAEKKELAEASKTVARLTGKLVKPKAKPKASPKAAAKKK